jgi:hypothetical protein
MERGEHAAHRRPVGRRAEVEVLERQGRSREGDYARCTDSRSGEGGQTFDFCGERFGAAGLDELTRG